MSENCIFCRIVRGQEPASIVYEDALVLALMDIRPVSEGHILVIPKEHYQDIFDIPGDLLATAHKVAKKVALAAKKAVEADGISIVQQNGAAAGQDIFHLHVHIIPRFEGRKMPRLSDLIPISRDLLEQTAVTVRHNLLSP